MANPLLIIGLLGVGGLLLLSAGEGSGASAPRKASWQKVKGLPTGNGVTWRLNEINGTVEPYVDGIPLKSIPDGKGGQRSANLGTINSPAFSGAQNLTADAAVYLERHRRLNDVMVKQFAERKGTLPPDADKTFIDAYSKELYLAPSWLTSYPEQLTLYDLTSRIWTPRDEYGRLKPGNYGSGGGFKLSDPTFGGLWDSTIGGIMKNPLGAAVITAVLVFGTGGAGIAVVGAYAMWQSRGTELTLKNIALQSARAYVVSQCGEACGMAFDFGVGVASGEDVDTAAENALVKQMTPEQRAAYDEGKKLYSEVV